jgi:hypothetical protein
MRDACMWLFQSACFFMDWKKRCFLHCRAFFTGMKWWRRCHSGLNKTPCFSPFKSSGATKKVSCLFRITLPWVGRACFVFCARCTHSREKETPTTWFLV